MSHEILFGTDLNTSRDNELKLNYCLLFAKYYLYYQKMYHKACNITECVLKLEQKLLLESRLKRKILVRKCFCPLTHLVSNLVFFFAITYYILYFRVLCLTVFCIILVLLNPLYVVFLSVLFFVLCKNCSYVLGCK